MAKILLVVLLVIALTLIALVLVAGVFTDGPLPCPGGRSEIRAGGRPRDDRTLCKEPAKGRLVQPGFATKARMDPSLVSGGNDSEHVAHDSETKSGLHEAIKTHIDLMPIEMQRDPHLDLKEEDPPQERRYGTLGSREDARDSKRKWHEFDSWSSMFADKRATKEYFADVRGARENLEFDWSKVWSKISPKLSSDREWAGLINIVPGSKNILEASHVIGSDTKLGEGVGVGYDGSIDVSKIMNIPALFKFHTHPDGHIMNSGPSDTDLTHMVYLGCLGRYAADAIICQYGIYVYGLSNQTYNIIHANKSEHWGLLMRKYLCDVAMFWKPIRSFTHYKSFNDLMAMLRYIGIKNVVLPRMEHAPKFRKNYWKTLDWRIEFELFDQRREILNEYLARIVESKTTHQRKK